MIHAIEADNLKKIFAGTIRALDGVSFAVEKGTVFGLLGPNGAGKTTAVRVLTTIVQPDAGSARVLGHDVVAEAGQVRSLIGLAGQYAAVDENLTGRENIFMVGRLNHLSRDVASARAAELLERFGLSDAGDRTLKTYSGGMRRRLDLAAALVARPPVLFLDEPTTGLDLRSRNDLWVMIEGLVDGGTTVLLTTQYLEEADRLAHRVAVVDHGHVIAEGTPEQLKADLGATVLAVGLPDPSTAAKAAEILDKVGTKPPSVDGSSIELPVDDGPRAAMEALRLLDARALVPTAFVLREPSLDDVFLALTGKRTEADDDDTDPAGDGPRGRSRKGARAPVDDRRIAMTTTAITQTGVTVVPDDAPSPTERGSRIGWAISDTLTITRRNFIVYTRIPEFLFFSTVQPIMFVLLFRYVFGGAIHPPPGYRDYADYLMPGIFVQSVAFGSISTAVGLSEDLQKGLLERFRALPMARSAVLTGRTTADLVRNVFVVGVITGVGYAVGFRIGAGVLAFLAGILVLLLFAYALSWGFAVIGLSAPNSETAQVMAFPILFPLVFASPAFVAVSSMPGWLQPFANHQPIGVVVIATRALMHGGPTASPLLQALAWCVGLMLLCVPFAVRQYRRRT